MTTFSRKMFLILFWNCVIKECVSSVLLDRRSLLLWRINLDSCPLLVGITKNCTWRRTEEDPANTSRSLEGDKSSCNQLVSFWFSSYLYHECKRFTYEESKMKSAPEFKVPLKFSILLFKGCQWSTRLSWPCFWSHVKEHPSSQPFWLDESSWTRWTACRTSYEPWNEWCVRYW